MPSVFGLAAVQIARPTDPRGQLRYRLPSREQRRSITVDDALHVDLVDGSKQAMLKTQLQKRRARVIRHKPHIEYIDDFEQDEDKQGRAATMFDMRNLPLDDANFDSQSPGHHGIGSPLPDCDQTRDFKFNRTAFNEANTYIFECQGILCDVSDMYNHRAEAEVLPLIVYKINAMIEADKKVFFLSNKPTQSRRTIVEKLGQKGIKIGMSDDGESLKVTEQNIISIGHTCAWWLKSQMSSKPYVMASYSGLLEDLRTTGITDYVERIEECGCMHEVFQKPAIAGHVSKSIGELPDVDAVLLGWDSGVTPSRIAVAAHYLSKNVPLLTCCSTEAQRKIERLGNGTKCKLSGISFPRGTPAIDLKMPSRALRDALKSPVKDSGYGIDVSKAVWIGSSFEKSVEFAHSCGMKCLLICNELDKIDLASESRVSRLPDWCLPTFAEA